MLDKVQKFVSTFRELERKEYQLSNEQEESWRQLKEKLSQVAVNETKPFQSGMQTIVIAGMYPRAGSSFLAGNYAYFLARNEISTTLCEFPFMLSYYYFSLDFERRVSARERKENTLHLCNRKLRIKANHPLSRQDISQTDAMQWFLTNHKNTSVLIIDISSHWRNELASWIMQMADQIWFVIDSDFPRLSQTVLATGTPDFWKANIHKIQIILNKWCDSKVQSKIARMIEGTVSLWDEHMTSPLVTGCIPSVDGQKVRTSHMEACLLLELFPDQEDLLKEFAGLDKGRFL